MMASFIRETDKDELVSCPYNPCHRMKKSRLQFHITKCQQYNAEEGKKICPFNASHHIAPPEYNHHLATCPNRDVVDRKLIKFSDEKEKITLEVSTNNDIGSSENWDLEIAPVPKPGYDPKCAQKKMIFHDISHMTPAERRQYYKNLHNTNEKNEESDEEVTEWKLKELRQPKDKPEVLQYQVPDHSLLGLGRGMAASSHRRIAANIFGHESNPIENSLYSVALGRGIGKMQQENTK